MASLYQHLRTNALGRAGKRARCYQGCLTALSQPFPQAHALLGVNTSMALGHAWRKHPEWLITLDLTELLISLEHTPQAWRNYLDAHKCAQGP